MHNDLKDNFYSDNNNNNDVILLRTYHVPDIMHLMGIVLLKPLNTLWSIACTQVGQMSQPPKGMGWWYPASKIGHISEGMCF